MESGTFSGQERCNRVGSCDGPSFPVVTRELCDVLRVCFVRVGFPGPAGFARTTSCRNRHPSPVPLLPFLHPSQTTHHPLPTMTLYYSLVFALLVFEMVVFMSLIVPMPFSWKRKLLTFISESPLIAKLQYWIKVSLYHFRPMSCPFSVSWPMSSSSFIAPMLTRPSDHLCLHPDPVR